MRERHSDGPTSCILNGAAMSVCAVAVTKRLSDLHRHERKAVTLMGDAQIAFELYAMFKRVDKEKSGKVRHEVRTSS